MLLSLTTRYLSALTANITATGKIGHGPPNFITPILLLSLIYSNRAFAFLKLSFQPQILPDSFLHGWFPVGYAPRPPPPPTRCLSNMLPLRGYRVTPWLPSHLLKMAHPICVGQSRPLYSSSLPMRVVLVTLCSITQLVALIEDHTTYHCGLASYSWLLLLIIKKLVAFMSFRQLVVLSEQNTACHLHLKVTFLSFRLLVILIVHLTPCYCYIASDSWPLSLSIR